MNTRNMVQDDANADDIFDEDVSTNEEDERVKAEILASFDDGDDEPDDAGMDQPLDDDKPLDLTSHTDGQRAIERGEEERRKERKTEDLDGKGEDDTADDDKPADPADDAKPGDAKSGEEGGKDAPDGDKPADAENALQSADFDSLLDGVPDDRKAEITRRMKESSDLMAPFQSPYVQEQIKRHGVAPKDIASRLVDLAEFAESKPDEYLAWAAQEMAASPDKVGEVLANAAKLHGYKLVKEDEAGDDDDDLFLDDRTKQLIEENRALKAAQKSDGPTFGPDTAERRQARDLQSQLQNFIHEQDENGNAKRPLWGHLETRITQMATQHKAATGKPITIADLGTFYDSAVEEARQALGQPPAPTPADPSAAQNGAGMADDLKKRAAAAEKARRASKSIGGAGQGASRQPAKSSDDDSDNTLDVVKRLAQDLGI